MNLFSSSSEKGLPGAVQPGRSAAISVLDVGSTKFCCMIARLRPRMDSDLLPGRTHTVEVLGIGHQRARGIKSGVITDMQEAERAMRLAIDSAERTAGMTVDSLLVSLSAGRLASRAYRSDITLGEDGVRREDIQAVLAAGVRHASANERTVVHALPVRFALDGQQNISKPIGMMGHKLGIDMHVVTAETAPLQNLELCLNRAHLGVDAMVATPYASGLAALVEDEARMGAACIDMGGGTTTVSIFLDGQLVFVDAIAVGGNHVTMDIARCLSIAVADAERLKVLHGTAQMLQTETHDVLSAASIDQGNSQPVQVSVSEMAQIIRPRVEETFELIRDRIAQSGFGGAIGKRVVITGGASQLAGVSDIASDILGTAIRLGRPLGIAGLPKSAKGPAFSAVAGMMIYPQIRGGEYDRQGLHTHDPPTPAGGPLSRLSRWVRQSF